MLKFLNFGIIDILDILIVAFIFYQFYQLIRNTTAEKVFTSLIILYFFWITIKALHFQLLGTIMQQLIGVGIIAVLIVFQHEVRRFVLVTVGRFSENMNNWNIPFFKTKNESKIPINEIITACDYFHKNSIGALIVISDKRMLESYYEAGQVINADVNTTLIQTIFFKNTALHDGAMFIVQDKIIAAGCVLPLTERTDLPYYLGLRHRAAIGISEETDALVIVVSEERGQISFAEYGKIYLGVEPATLRQKMLRKFYTNGK